MSYTSQNQLLAQISGMTKLLLIAEAFLVAYDYLCRTAKIYFFWESGVIGWYLLLLGSIAFLVNRIDAQSTQRKSAVIEKAVVFGLVFLLIIKVIVFGIFASSDAFETASTYLKTNSQISNKIGPVSGVILLSEGEVHTVSNSKGEQGEGVINLIAKGRDEYRQFEVHLIKKYGMNTWQVIEVQE